MKITDEMVERAARAMCERDGFRWDAASVMETANGDEPEQQREYWLDKADAALTAALAVQTQQGVEELTWYDTDERNGYGRFIRVAGTAFGSYRILKGSQGRFEVYFGYSPFSGSMMTLEEAEAWGQSDYETRIRSALVDVPAVESEPVAWLTKIYSNDGLLLDTRLDFVKPTIMSTAKTEFIPVYAHPPRSLSNEGNIVAAAAAVLKSWDQRLAPEQERKARLAGTDHEYWSPAASMVSSEAISNLRTALSTRKAAEGSATDVKGPEHG